MEPACMSWCHKPEVQQEPKLTSTWQSCQSQLPLRALDGDERESKISPVHPVHLQVFGTESL